MTRRAYDSCVDVTARRAEVIRVFERYLVEVVERYDLCPWARGAREAGEVAVAVVWDTPSDDAWVAAAEALLASPTTRVAMVIAPQCGLLPAELRALRDRIAGRIPRAGVAEFHPDAALDLASPARAVPFARRSPDPLLQLVPLAILDHLRGAPLAAGLAHQAQMLGGTAAPPRRDAADRIAEINHATLLRAHGEIERALDAIAADRDAAYARVGITSSR
jgi:hypothetical protein